MSGIGSNDILAFGDVLADFAAEAETAPMDRLVELDGALTTVAYQLAGVRSLIGTAMLRLVEARSITVDGVRFFRKRKLRKVADHPAIRAAIVQRAVVDDEGELISNPRIAAERATTIVYELFLSASSAPKVSGCKMLGRSYEELVDVEEVGSELGREELRAVPG